MPRKLGLHNYTQFHKRHQKALLVIGSILEVFEPASLKRTVNATQGPRFVFISLLHLDGWEKRKTCQRAKRENECKKEEQFSQRNLYLIATYLLVSFKASLWMEVIIELQVSL